MIRTLQVVSAKDAQQELEAHEKLGNQVIEALRGDDGKAETGPGPQGPQRHRPCRD